MTTKTETKPKDDTLPQQALVTLEDKRARLRAIFPKAAYGLLPKPTKKENAKGKCQECGGWHGLPAVHLDYIGHATVTDRLLEVDPEWNWEPCSFGEDGLPRFIISESGTPIGLWIRLTVLGVTRLGFGSVESNAFEPEKQLIGDAMRNAAMRFGVALDLWSKAELESAALAHEAKNGNGHSEAPKPAKPQPPKTLAQAAERAQAPRTVEAKPVPSKQPEPAQAVVDDGTAPVLEKVPNGYRYWGCFIEEKIVDNYNRWKIYQVESKKDQHVNGKPWAEMPFGSKGGGREGWLSSVAAWCAGIQNTDHKSNQLGERAAYSLFLMHDRFYREQQELVLNGEFEERTGIHIDPKGTSKDATPWPTDEEDPPPF